MKHFLKRVYFKVFGNPMALNRYLRIMYIKPLLINIENKKVLDVGCGDGSFTKYLVGRSNKVFAIDIKNQNIEKKLPQVIYKKADARKLPFKNATFDFVFCSDVLEHVENYQKIVKEITRVTKKGGECLISTVSGYWNSPIKLRKFLFRLPDLPRHLILGKFDIPDKKLHREFLGHVNYDITPEEIVSIVEKKSLNVKTRKYCSTFGSFLMEIYFSLNLKVRYFIFPMLKSLLLFDSLIKGEKFWQFYVIAKKV